MEIIKIKNLTYYYPRQDKPAIENINLSINEGEFILVLGKSGSGKSTLARVFNRIVPEFYGGAIKGEVKTCCDIGMLFQDPEKQLVMDKVEREIAFGLENLGKKYETMRKKVMETLSFLNMWDIKDKKTYELSGGQRQKVAIGATLAMGYRVLVLDEPTSQLDPVTAEEILHVLKRLNEELGYTIILVEQRIDRTFHLADRILFMDEGRLAFDGTPQEFVLWNTSGEVNFSPTISSFFIRLGASGEEVPLTVKEGRRKLKEVICNKIIKGNLTNINKGMPKSKKEAIVIKKLGYTYENGKEALRDVDLTVYGGEVLGIMGENGSGKSTLLKNISGILKPTKGQILVNGKVGYLSQNPNDYLFNDTVYEELKFTLDNINMGNYEIIEKTLKDLNLSDYKHKNPRDLSGGERQRVALASILVMEPDIVLLDEPTRGIDRKLKDKIGNLILRLKERGKTVILVTHDVEFVGKYCDRISLIFDGEIAKTGTKYDVLDSGIYYATQINKLFRGYGDGIVTLEDGLEFMNQSMEKGVS